MSDYRCTCKAAIYQGLADPACPIHGTVAQVRDENDELKARIAELEAQLSAARGEASFHQERSVYLESQLRAAPAQALRDAANHLMGWRGETAIWAATELRRMAEELEQEKVGG